MGSEENGDMEFQQAGGGGDSILNCPSSGMNSSGANPFFGSGWDPLVSLSHNENYGAPFSVLMENQRNTSTSHLVNYPSDSGLVEMVPKLPCFGSGSFSEMVGSFGLQGCGQMTNSGFPPNKEGGNGGHSQDDCQLSDEGTMGASPNGRKKRRALESHSPFNPNKNVEEEQPKDHSGDSSEQDEKKQKIEETVNANLRGKQTGKQAKDTTKIGEDPKDNYIHVRARRGQATNSHSLAERVRRERISERMKLLQELVPGCNKITGKAVMLDEIINYVQSLQQQVEFLSMKLATVNPELNIDIERVLSKDILHSRGGNAAAILGFGPGMSSSHPYPQGIPQGTLSGIPSTNAPFHAMPQNLWDSELQSLLQMGFDSNPAINNLGPNGRSKFEL